MMARLWNIPTGKIIDWQKTTDFITSVQFSPNSKKLLVGVFKGQCFVFSYEPFKFLLVG
jgi:WD40 repeat protein